MAEEAEEAGGGAAAGGSVLKKYGPLAAIVLLAQVVLAWVVITVVLKDKIGGRDADEPLLSSIQKPQTPEGEAQPKELPFWLQREQLTKITANPAGTNASRFVVVGVQLGLVGRKGDGEAIKRADIGTDTDALGMIDANLGKIRAIIVSILKRKYVDQLEQEQPEILEEIKDELNRKVFERIEWSKDGKKSVSVSEVIFTEQIIQ